jgi:hypothetical protein
LSNERTTDSSNQEVILPECKFCGKKLKNQNAHSGHMGSCSKRLSARADFRRSYDAIFSSEQESLDRWNTLDHSHFELRQFEARYSEGSIEFLLEQFTVLEQLPHDRVEKYCLFYLVVLAQIAASPSIRKKSTELLEQLTSPAEYKLLLTFWKQLGDRRYEPTTEAFLNRWEKFVRIKDVCFFNIDYPVWILLIDRYLLTFKGFGWHPSGSDGVVTGYYDNVLLCVINLLRLEQDYIGLPASPRYQMHVPNAAIALLHPSSRKRFSRTEPFWIALEKMEYDPSDPECARYF